MVDQLPGMNLFNVLAQAPIDLANLGIKQANEFMGVMNVGAQRLAAEIAVPPVPSAMQGLALQGLPQLPALSSLVPPGISAPAAGAKAADVYASDLIQFGAAAAGPRVVI